MHKFTLRVAKVGLGPGNKVLSREDFKNLENGDWTTVEGVQVCENYAIVSLINTWLRAKGYADTPEGEPNAFWGVQMRDHGTVWGHIGEIIYDCPERHLTAVEQEELLDYLYACYLQHCFAGED